MSENWWPAQLVVFELVRSRAAELPSGVLVLWIKITRRRVRRGFFILAMGHGLCALRALCSLFPKADHLPSPGTHEAPLCSQTVRCVSAAETQGNADVGLFSKEEFVRGRPDRSLNNHELGIGAVDRCRCMKRSDRRVR